MFLILFALSVVIPWALSDKVSTKPGLKLFRDEYKSVTEACLDLGFAKTNCKSDTEIKKVAFDARLKNLVSNLATKGRVVFDVVDLNEGKGYDPSTGIFSASASGVYVFDWTTLTHYGKNAHTSLVVNGKLKSWNYCYGADSKIFAACSKMTVVKLKQGDKVWVGVFSGPANLYRQYTSFTGYKL